MMENKFDYLALAKKHGYREDRHRPDEVVRRLCMVRSFAELEELTHFSKPGGCVVQTMSDTECDNYFSMDYSKDKVKLLLRHRIILPLLRGELTLDRDKYEKELDKIVYETGLLLYVAKDIIVSRDYPLIISDQSACTLFGKVTIKPGGYIAIRTNCAFHCEVMFAEADETAKTSGHIRVICPDGEHGQPGENGLPGADGSSGDPGTCDCCGGIAYDNATNGNNGSKSDKADGKPGSPGLPGANPMDTVKIEIAELEGDLYIYNAGGRGGDGGKGGNGGNGGKGGDGGSGRVCGAEVGKSGSGGNGGDGGKGADGGIGGNGGKGSHVQVSVLNKKGHNVYPINAQADGGIGGAGGSGGAGGAGGHSGGSGGNGGSKGTDGKPGKEKADDGIKGEAGSIDIY